MPGEAAADLFVGRVWGKSSGISGSGGNHAFLLPEPPFCAPETTHSENCPAKTCIERPAQRRVEHEVTRRHRDCLIAAGQCAIRGYHFNFPVASEHRISPLLRSPRHCSAGLLPDRLRAAGASGFKAPVEKGAAIMAR